MTGMTDATDTQMEMLADLVDALRVAEQTLAGMQAARDGMFAMASRLALDIARQGAHPDHGDMALRTVAAEIGAAQRVSDRTIERRMSEASLLVDEFPMVWAAQGAGRIAAAHARVIVEAGAHLDEAEDREAYAASALEVAVVESPNRLRRLARRIAERYQPRSVTARHRDAREKRRVWLKDLDDGMSELGIYGPSVLLHGMHDRLSQMARVVMTEGDRTAGTGASAGGADAGAADRGRRGTSVEEAGNAGAAGVRGLTAAEPAATGTAGVADTAGVAEATGAGVDVEDPAGGSDDPRESARTIDQLRADLLADLVLTAAPAGHDGADDLLGAIRARVEVTVPVLTLIRSGGSPAAQAPLPAELDGRVPIDIDTARLLTGGAAGWERVLTHPISGALLAVDRYRPGDQLKRHLRARDQRCRFPGCGIAARSCDIDHNHAASAGGSTCAENLAHFCRRHHTMKHHSPWKVTQTDAGDVEWRSPTGQIYVDRPPPQNTVRFTSAGDQEGEGTGGEGRGGAGAGGEGRGGAGAGGAGAGTELDSMRSPTKAVPF